LIQGWFLASGGSKGVSGLYTSRRIAGIVKIKAEGADMK
jgi:hypothetical protein